ncbi:MAG: hypothetical protein ACTSUE_03155 [Promethearchaeota archaeon]
MEKQPTTLKKDNRLVALDILKGFSIVYIIFEHFGMWWGDSTWRSLWRAQVMFMDWAAPSLFVIASALGTMISIGKKVARGTQRGMFRRFLPKFVYFLIMGEILNVFIECMNPYKLGSWALLGMNVITAISFQQLLIYGLIKLSIKGKVIILFSLTILYYILFPFCIDGMGFDVNERVFPLTAAEISTSLPHFLYFMLFHMSAMSPTLTWMITTVLSLIVFKDFVDYITGCIGKPRTTTGRNVLHEYHAKKLVTKGLVLLFLTLMFGGIWILSKGIEINRGTYLDFHNGDMFNFWPFEGHPLIWQRHVPHSLFYNVSIFMIVFGTIFYWADVKQRTTRFRGTMLILGRLTFSLFVYSHIFGAFPAWFFPDRLPLLPTTVISVPLLLLTIYLSKIWMEKAKAIFSIEWGYIMYLKALSHLKMRKKNRPDHTVHP